MKVTPLSVSFIFLLLLFYACQTPTQSDDTGTEDSADVSANAHHSQNALDWQGTYTSTLPCADCEGIETSLTLNKDLSYRIKTTYLGKDDEAFEKVGTFSWNLEGNTITLNNMEDGPAQYLVGENTLTQLDRDGNKISGALEEKYILKKNTMDENGSISGDAITGTRWKLIEIIGQPIDSTVNEKEPFIMLTAEDERIMGNGGCNNISGSYELKDSNRISFSQMISTKMACPNMEVEEQLLKVLETADNYSLNGNQLTLNKARMAPLARFEAVSGNE